MTTEAEHYVLAAKLANDGPAEGQSKGSLASCIVEECVAANLSIAKAEPLFIVAHDKHNIRIGIFRDLWKARTKGDSKASKDGGIMQQIMSDGVELWHDQDGTGFITFKRDGHKQTVALESKRFKEWLVWRYYDITGNSVGGDTVKNAMASAQARAFYAGTEHRSWIRTAEADGKLYLDLGDDDWTVIEIDADGWRVAKDPPVRFRRGGGRALPMPVQGGSIDPLWQFVNVTHQSDRMLILAAMVATFRPGFPFPLLFLAGESSAAKSSGQNYLRNLIDPCKAGSRGMPKTEDDILVTANSNLIFGVDNVSVISGAMSDALCRLITGGGIGKRGLYTDADEFVLEAIRPIFMNGLSFPTDQQDLLSRTILVTLSVLDPTKIKTEAKLDALYERERPKLIGALLDAVSVAIRRLPKIKLEESARMADFMAWGEAAGEAFGWKPKAFSTVYTAACSDLFRNVAEADLLTKTIVRYLKQRHGQTMEGTAFEILEWLNRFVTDDNIKRASKWPKDAQWMGRRLVHITKGLRAAGVSVEVGRDTDRMVDTYTLTLVAPGAKGNGAASDIPGTEEQASGTPAGEPGTEDDRDGEMPF